MISTAYVRTDRPVRYGKQLVAHMSRKVEGAWDSDGADGYLVLGTSRVTLTAQGDGLVLELTADTDDVDRVEHVVGIHLARFGARDGLVVSWQRDDGAPGTSQCVKDPDDPGPVAA